jgi:Zn-dependent peptidase ImmA (M78 family)
MMVEILAKNLGYEIKKRRKSSKYSYATINFHKKQIWINRDLKTYDREIILLHEIGHAILHILKWEQNEDMATKLGFALTNHDVKEGMKLLSRKVRPAWKKYA